MQKQAVLQRPISGAHEEQTHTALRVMSFNIRYDTPEDGVDQWRYRKDDLCQMVASQKPGRYSSHAQDICNACCHI